MSKIKNISHDLYKIDQIKYTKYIICFDEELLPFKEKTFDLIIANFSDSHFCLHQM